jgi:hypothetical protein
MSSTASSRIADLRTHVYQDGEGWVLRRVYVWCPGCEEIHPFTVEVNKESPTYSLQSKEIWDWNGDLENPTFSPSLLVDFGLGKKCHSFLENAHWRFLEDSTHPLAGKTVPVPPLPDWWTEEPEDEE